MTKEESTMTNTNTEVLTAIQDHLAARGIDRTKIVSDAHLLRDLDLDSLDTVELTLGIEERFAIEVPDSELEDVETVEDIVALITTKVSIPS